MVSWKTKMKERGFYIYGIVFLSFFFLVASYYVFVLETDMVSFDTYLLMAFVLMTAIMIAVVGVELSIIKRRLKLKGTCV